MLSVYNMRICGINLNKASLSFLIELPELPGKFEYSNSNTLKFCTSKTKISVNIHSTLNCYCLTFLDLSFLVGWLF